MEKYILLMNLILIFLPFVKPSENEYYTYESYEYDSVVLFIKSFYEVNLNRPLTQRDENLVQLLLFSNANITGLSRCFSRTSRNVCLRLMFYNNTFHPFDPEVLFEHNFDDFDDVDDDVSSGSAKGMDDSIVVGLQALHPISKYLESVQTFKSEGVLKSIDFANCGVHPACAIYPLPKNMWFYICDQTIIVFIAVIGVFLSAIVIISNFLIIIVTLSSKLLKKPHEYFKISLAASDLLAGVFVIPSMVHNSLNTIDYDRQVYTNREAAVFVSVDPTVSSGATFFGVMGILSNITAVFSLLLLAIDSFLSVKWPMKYKIGAVMTRRKALVLVAIVWIASFLLGFLPLLAQNIVSYGLSSFTFQYLPIINNIPGSTIDDSPIEKFPHAVAYVILVWGIPLLAAWICTISTSVESRRNMKATKEARSSRSRKIVNKIKKDLDRTVIIVLALFTVTLLPVIISGMVRVLQSSEVCSTQMPVYFFFFSTYVLICGRFLNVIIYNIFNEEFRLAFNKFIANLMKAILHCNSDDQFS